jgi:pimeloyl-ACP methyl ester carboxylesterase
MARFRASKPARRIGTLFINPGGPGGSGRGFVFAVGAFLDAQLGGRFDIVGFDPRGVGRSDPLHCFDSRAALGAFLWRLPLFPYRAEQYWRFFKRFDRLGPECLDDRERIARHMSTADVARDLDRLRRAVGDRRLSYLGFSYGSYIGSTYANLFPRRVRALVIDGVLDPRLWSSGWQISSDRVATQEVFDEFIRLCDAAATQCAFWTPNGSQERWDRLVRAVRRQPVVLPGGFRYTYDLLIEDAAGAMYAPEVWDGRRGAAAWFDMVADIALGDADVPPDAERRRRSLLDRLEATYDNAFDAFFGNHCADTEYPSSFRAFREIGRYAGEASRFGPGWWWFNSGCSSWPVNRDRYTGPWRTRTSSPALIVGNLFDPATAYSGAVATSRLLRNSRLLTYAGWGHTAYIRSECVTARVNDYLLTRRLPPAGTVCPANPNPFLPVAGRRVSGPREPEVGLPASWMMRR